MSLAWTFLLHVPVDKAIHPEYRGIRFQLTIVSDVLFGEMIFQVFLVLCIAGGIYFRSTHHLQCIIFWQPDAMEVKLLAVGYFII